MHFAQATSRKVMLSGRGLLILGMAGAACLVGGRR